MSDEQLIEQLNKEAINLGSRNFEAKACIPAEPTDTDELMTRAADRIQQLTKSLSLKNAAYENANDLLDKSQALVKQLTDERDKAIKENERLRDGITELRNIERKNAEGGGIAHTSESIANFLDTLLKEQP